MTTVEISEMSTVERFRAMEDLWDVLCHDDQEVESPEWHGGILEERKKKIENSKAEFISIKDLKTGVR